MPLPWLYWMRLMPATNSPANLSAAGPAPVSSCSNASHGSSTPDHTLLTVMQVQGVRSAGLMQAFVCVLSQAIQLSFPRLSSV